MLRVKYVRNNHPQKRNRSPVWTGKLLVGIGASLIALALILIAAIFWPVILNELSYQFHSRKPVRAERSVMVPKDTNAGILIPKIRANASVVWEVDPYNDKIYQQALTKGVAHAKGSAYPGQIGNVFIFSHSSQDFLTANRYNSIFYLLTKLEKDDEIYLFYKGKPYIYSVTGHEIVKPDAVSLLTKKINQRELTLMTCWPPGTTLQRYIVKAVAKE
jgi:sortase A